jgi:hypothetical protein
MFEKHQKMEIVSNLAVFSPLSKLLWFYLTIDFKLKEEENWKICNNSKGTASKGKFKSKFL